MSGLLNVRRFSVFLISRPYYSTLRFGPNFRQSATSLFFYSKQTIRLNTMSQQKKKVTIVGSGNWGSAIARIVGVTTKENPSDFDSDVIMYVYEEQVEGGKLSEIINTQHENVKYLPGKKLPENVRAVTDLVESCKDADVLIFVVPHQFVNRICDQLKGKLKQNAVAISLIKGVAVGEGSGIHLISEIIKSKLNIEVAVLMGANLAPEVANENFCEATIGTKDVENLGLSLKKLFHTDYFRINVVQDAHTVELCGALKNVVACAAGFSDGLGFGDNTKAAIIRLGLMETVRFVELFYPGSKFTTFFESCGIADLVTTCYGGRNRKVCAAFAKTGKTIAELEKELLNGQSAQGPPTAAELYQTLEKRGVTDQFPLFVAVHKICIGELPVDKLIDRIRHHPEHKVKVSDFS
ncbi:Glycerol-3-phosphate dehydrogenase [NAD(+)] [Aphelenchoides besseyi]|nr:Glycerol-3-phosphate dehydrogenase [NAD(+)] [Aphelenchoides besseyi]